ncbi:hypothetical protein DFO58_0522 [Arthrobacter sp. AG1021]|uniref:hypothetical protein n=1 Tax=Arthrobacter sp. AG1021 TaxID=2183908 RepID=UPI000EB1DA92|nr:hypothetical protein [Arthrobacter sp. AG1021]RKS22491.1 hypothetical protein DFO58_0522 [Arthrobacter sp. AG1021]
MMTRRDAAIALDIPLEMAKKHGIPSKMSEAEFRELNSNPPAWLAQSRANRTGKRPVWVHLVCEVCGTEDYERPKKWWPTFDFVHCSHHSPAQLPKLEAGKTRVEYPDISARMYGIVDED